MTGFSRRSVLAGGATLPIAVRASAAEAKSVAADLDRYVGYGNKQAGGSGDEASGDWLAGELERAGFTVERQAISVPFFTTHRAELASGGVKAAVWPQRIVVPTADEGVSGPLVRIDGGSPLAGAIALLELPFARWSTAVAKPIATSVAAAFAAEAKAVVVITTGPTGEAIPLNADGRMPMFPGPVALLAPRDARPFLAAAQRGARATLTVTGEGGRRSAFNLVGRIDRGRSRWVAVSTPRSGWNVCAGERGPGIAAWLALARWASTAVRGHDLAFSCTSGHEYEYMGAAEALKVIAPRPQDTALWLHLGANVAARDWHEAVEPWKPLPSADPQRFLAVSPALLPAARRAFAGLPGLEAPYPTDTLSGGELTEVMAAGYRTVAGVFGAHRYHHVAEDDARCVAPETVATTAAAFRRFMAEALRLV